MNKATRASIEKIVNALETLGDEVESLHDDEQEKFDNAPEGRKAANAMRPLKPRPTIWIRRTTTSRKQSRP